MNERAHPSQKLGEVGALDFLRLPVLRPGAIAKQGTKDSTQRARLGSGDGALVPLSCEAVK
jgi:hypothetical protein